MAGERRRGATPPRRLVAESWARATAGRLAPDHAEASLPLAPDALEDARRAHPLAAALPVIRSLLVRDADEDSGVVVAVGDAAGRLLWVEGDPRLVRRAEEMRFVAGADWSEARVGTSAPGTALALDAGVQIAGEEHFALQVRAWSCTAVPVHDLETHETIGVLDISGGPDVVRRGALPLLTATAAAVERELLVQRLRSGRRRANSVVARAVRLDVLGRDGAALTTGNVRTELSLRHAELLTLLAWHRGGLSAERLALLVHGRSDAVVTTRAEMVRLRHVLQGAAPLVVPLARPYRLPVPVELDAARLLRMLDRGAHRAALDAWAGPVLPASIAPGIEEIREEVGARLRESVLESASPELLIRYADRVGGPDPAPLLAALQLLPTRSRGRSTSCGSTPTSRSTWCRAAAAASRSRRPRASAS